MILGRSLGEWLFVPDVLPAADAESLNAVRRAGG